MLARSAQTGIKIHISVKTRLSPRTKFFIESKQYEQVFKFSDPYPTNQIIRNNIDGGDVLSQQYLQRIIAESSVTAARKLHGPSRRTLVNDSWRQIYSGPYKCYRQRCPDSNSTSYQKEESTTAAPDHELN